MKKFLTVIAILLVVTCLVGALAACSSTKGIKFKKAHFKVDHTTPIVADGSMISEITALAGTDYVNRSENGLLVKTRSTDSEDNFIYNVYNVKTGEVIVSSTKDAINFYAEGDNAFYLRSAFDADANNYKTSLYDSKGKCIAFKAADGSETTVYTSVNIPVATPRALGFYSFADNLFLVDSYSDAVTWVNRQSALVNFNFNSLDKASKDYYYDINEDEGYALIFDKKLNLVTTHYVQGNFNNITINPLESGDLVVQTTRLLMDEEKDYTYILNGRKYLLKTYIVDAKTGKQTEKKFKYVINELAPMDADLTDMIGFSIKAENVAVIYPIEDKHLLTGATNKMAVSLSSKLKIKGRLDQLLPDQVPGTIPDTDGAYLSIRTPLGDKLVKADGTVVGYCYYNGLNNETMFEKDDKIFSFELKQLIDLEKEGYTIATWMNNSVILRKVGPDGTLYYRLDATMSAPVVINSVGTDPTNYVAVNKYMYAIRSVVDGNYVYSFYNDKGEAINTNVLPTNASVAQISALDDAGAILLSASIYDAVNNENVTHYYRVAK